MDIREEIVKVLCPFYEDCVYRKESSCFTLGSEWCICRGADKANIILSKIADYIKTIELPIGSTGNIQEACRRTIIRNLKRLTPSGKE